VRPGPGNRLGPTIQGSRGRDGVNPQVRTHHITDTLDVERCMEIHRLISANVLFVRSQPTGEREVQYIFRAGPFSPGLEWPLRLLQLYLNPDLHTIISSYIAATGCPYQSYIHFGKSPQRSPRSNSLAPRAVSLLRIYTPSPRPSVSRSDWPSWDPGIGSRCLSSPHSVASPTQSPFSHPLRCLRRTRQAARTSQHIMCDYTQVEYRCGHLRYTVRAWCITYEKTHIRCPHHVVAIEFRYVFSECVSHAL
jgi:hypothetical protein